MDAITIDDIISEMASIKTYIDARPVAVGVDTDSESVKHRLASTVAMKITSINTLNTIDAGRIQSAIPKDILSAASVQLIVQSIDARLQQLAPMTESRTLKVQQVSKKPWLLMTLELSNYLQDKSKSLTSKIDMCVTHFKSKCGISNPHEQTYKWVLATLVSWHFEQFPKYRDVFGLLGDVKQAWKSAIASNDCPFRIVEYPDDPTLLPPIMQTIIFEGNQPNTTEPPRIYQLANFHIPLRSSSKLLTNEMRKDADQNREESAIAIRNQPMNVQGQTMHLMKSLTEMLNPTTLRMHFALQHTMSISQVWFID